MIKTYKVLAGDLCLVLLLLACADQPALVSDPGEGPENLKVLFFDVGQGDASLVSYRTIRVLIDGGDEAHGDSLVRYLLREEVDTLDLIILSHSHADHFGGLAAVLRSVPVKRFLHNGMSSSLWPYGELMSLVRDSLPQTYEDTVRAGETLLLDNMSIHFLAPGTTMYSGPDSMNAQSVVCRFNADGASVLYTGDIPAAVESVLVTNWQGELAADVLKAAHHGSRYSSCTFFLEAVHPAYGIISCGTDNDYGHPHEECLDRFTEQAIPVFRTDRDGTCVVSWVAEGGTLSIRPAED